MSQSQVEFPALQGVSGEVPLDWLLDWVGALEELFAGLLAIGSLGGVQVLVQQLPEVIGHVQHLKVPRHPEKSRMWKSAKKLVPFCIHLLESWLQLAGHVAEVLGLLHHLADQLLLALQVVVVKLLIHLGKFLISRRWCIISIQPLGALKSTGWHSSRSFPPEPTCADKYRSILIRNNKVWFRLRRDNLTRSEVPTSSLDPTGGSGNKHFFEQTQSVLAASSFLRLGKLVSCAIFSLEAFLGFKFGWNLKLVWWVTAQRILPRKVLPLIVIVETCHGSILSWTSFLFCICCVCSNSHLFKGKCHRTDCKGMSTVLYRRMITVRGQTKPDWILPDLVFVQTPVLFGNLNKRPPMCSVNRQFKLKSLYY